MHSNTVKHSKIPENLRHLSARLAYHTIKGKRWMKIQTLKTRILAFTFFSFQPTQIIPVLPTLIPHPTPFLKLRTKSPACQLELALSFRKNWRYRSFENEETIHCERGWGGTEIIAKMDFSQARRLRHGEVAGER